jgi:hypothetical protein
MNYPTMSIDEVERGTTATVIIKSDIRNSMWRERRRRDRKGDNGL